MQPGASPQRPLQRQVFSDFTRPTAHRDPSMRPVRPTTQTAPTTPAQPVASAPVHVKPVHATHVQPVAHAPQPSVPPTAPVLTSPAPTPAAPSSALRPPATFSDFAPTASTPATPVQPSEAQPSLQPPQPVPETPQPSDDHQQKHSKSKKEPGPKNTTGRSGLVGLICFVLFSALFFLPLLPGKVLDNFPGSSASFSTGDQALSCIENLGVVHSTVKYDTKMGFPITYNYSTTTTQMATCKGVSQSVTGGHTAQFNPLGGLIDVVAASALAFGVAKLWRWFFGRTQ